VSRIRISAACAAAMLGALVFPAIASAQSVSVFGGVGEDCWRAASTANLLKMQSSALEARWKADAIGACDDALKSGALDRRDIAATWVNRGILEMSRERYATARGNFKDALSAVPDLPEAHVNIGSALINLEQYAEGIKETELGLSLGAKQPERAWYNLGIAYGRLGDTRKAYDSYRQAAALSPDWDDPRIEVKRYEADPANAAAH
jgi:tetratricopeptide (TPR) repeat protein